MAEGTVSPELRRNEGRFHLYSVEKSPEELSVQETKSSSPTTFRTTCTAAVAVEDVDDKEDIVTAFSLPDEDDDSAAMHAVLEAATRMLLPGDRCILGVALENNTHMVVVLHCEGQAAIMGLEQIDGNFVIAVVVPIQGTLRLDGDGGFHFVPFEATPATTRRVYTFKPASVRSLWSAVQSLMKLLESADPTYLLWHWLLHYRQQIPDATRLTARWSFEVQDKLTELEQIRRQRLEAEAQHAKSRTTQDFENALTVKLRELMFNSDLDNITAKQVREGLEKHFGSLKEYKAFIDNQMITIMGQMESASKIFDYLHLGTEWNACNKEELEAKNCRYIINVTKEIPNAFPGKIKYLNIRIYDTPTAELLPHWDDTYRFIREARRAGSSVLVHCKMGVSRSASTVIAYAMKQYSWTLEVAYAYVKKRRSIIKPNEGFKQQLIVYEGILRAQRESRSWGRKLKGRGEDLLASPTVVGAPTAQQPHGDQTIVIRAVTPPSSPHTTPPSSPTLPRARDFENLSDSDEGSDKRRLNSFSSNMSSSPNGSDSDEAPPTVANLVARFLSEEHSATARPKSLSPTCRGSPPSNRNSGAFSDAGTSPALSAFLPHARTASPSTLSTGRESSPACMGPSVRVPSPLGGRAVGVVHAFAPPVRENSAPELKLTVVNDFAQDVAPPMRTISNPSITIVNGDFDRTAVIPVSQASSPEPPSSAADSVCLSDTPNPARIDGAESAASDRPLSQEYSLTTPSVISSSDAASDRRASMMSVVTSDEDLLRASTVVPSSLDTIEDAVQQVQCDVRDLRTELLDAVHALTARVQLLEMNLAELLPAVRRLENDGATPLPIADEPCTNVLAWQPDELAAWLQRQGLQSGAALVIEHGIMGADFVDLTHDDLRALGVVVFTRRKELLRAAWRLRAAIAPEDVAC
eukprot:m.40631 g.40631  ORF g.40631 m.40631 type:complete len:922 (+) comp5624_c0_seq1:186-2951(+)